MDSPFLASVSANGDPFAKHLTTGDGASASSPIPRWCNDVASWYAITRLSSSVYFSRPEADTHWHAIYIIYLPLSPVVLRR